MVVLLVGRSCGLATLVTLLLALSVRSSSSTNRDLLSTLEDSHRLDCTPAEVQQSACLNGGVCFALEIDSHRSVHCQCTILYEGSRCQYQSLCFIAPDLCAPVHVHFSKSSSTTTTQPTTTTLTTTTMKTTVSSAGSMIRRCSTSEMQKVGCLNGGKCVNGGGTLYCRCVGHYRGRRCQYQDPSVDFLGRHRLGRHRRRVACRKRTLDGRSYCSCVRTLGCWLPLASRNLGNK